MHWKCSDVSFSILARGERLREGMLADAADLRITRFQSPAEDEKEEGLSLDRLAVLGAPHIWGVRVAVKLCLRYRGRLSESL